MNRQIQLPSELSLFEITEKLGSGSSGEVYRIRAKKNYAVKVMSRKESFFDNMAQNEFKIGKELADDRYYVEYYDLYKTRSHFFLLEKDELNLPSYLYNNRVGIRELLQILKNIIAATINMNRKGIYHFDIKPENIYMSERGKAKLGDFSHAAHMKKGAKHKIVKGSGQFIAPEVLQQSDFSGKEDMYSLGILIYVLLSDGKYPYDVKDRKPAYRQKEDAFVPDDRISEEMLSIIKRATAYMPGERYMSLTEMLGEFAMAMEIEEEFRNQAYGMGYGYGNHYDDFDITVPCFNGNVPNQGSFFQPPPYADTPTVGNVFDLAAGNAYDSAADYSYADNNTAFYGGGDTLSQLPYPMYGAGNMNAKEDIEQSSPLRISDVSFSAFSDRSVKGNNIGIIEIAMYEDKYRKTILRRIKEEYKKQYIEKRFDSTVKVKENQNIKVILYSKDIEIEDDTVTKVWKKDGLLFSFDYEVPKDYEKNRIRFTAEVCFDNVPAATLIFHVDVEEAQVKQEKQICTDMERIDITKAFLSYASKDRKWVTFVLQGIKKARDDLDVFMDAEKLRSSEDWENRLYKELNQSEKLFLCWSTHARESEWVGKEWRYMLETKGIEAIDPIPLEDPAICPPPEELKGKHFNDLMVQLRNAPVSIDMC